MEWLFVAFTCLLLHLIMTNINLVLLEENDRQEHKPNQNINIISPHLFLPFNRCHAPSRLLPLKLLASFYFLSI